MAWMARLEESGTIAGRFQRRSARNAWLAVPLLLCAAQAFVSGATSWQASRRHGRIARHGVEELYAEGMSCLKSGSDLARGVRCMQEASEKGFAPADTVLGSAYAEGMFGVPRDLDQAKYYLERGAEGGDNRAHFNLGILKLRGKNGFPQDKRQLVRRHGSEPQPQLASSCQCDDLQLWSLGHLSLRPWCGGRA